MKLEDVIIKYVSLGIDIAYLSNVGEGAIKHIAVSSGNNEPLTQDITPAVYANLEDSTEWLVKNYISESLPKLDSLLIEIDNLNVKIDDLNAEIIELLAEIDSLNGDKRELQAEVDRLTIEVANLRANVHALQVEVQNLESEIVSFNAHVDRINRVEVTDKLEYTESAIDGVYSVVNAKGVYMPNDIPLAELKDYVSQLGSIPSQVVMCHIYFYYINPETGKYEYIFEEHPLGSDVTPPSIPTELPAIPNRYPNLKFNGWTHSDEYFKSIEHDMVYCAEYVPEIDNTYVYLDFPKTSTPDEPITVNFSLTRSNTSDGYLRVHWGDGTYDTITVAAINVTLAHTYVSGNQYTIEVEAVATTYSFNSYILGSAANNGYIVSAVISSAVTAISSAFNTAMNLRFILSAAISVGVFTNCRRLEGYVIPRGVVTLSGFNGCSSLQLIGIPDTITRIASSALIDCYSLQCGLVLDTITAGTSSPVLTGCTSVPFVVTPYATQSLNLNVLVGVKRVWVYGMASNAVAWSLDGAVRYTNVFYLKSKKSEAYKSFSILASTAYYVYVASDGVSLSSSSTLREVTWGVPGDGVLTIASVTALKSLNVPEGYTSINANGCNVLVDIKLPSTLEALEVSAFRECRSLVAIEIPEGVSVIPSGCFTNCYGLESVKLPNSITMIDSSAFMGCKKLRHIDIPRGVTALNGISVFSDCNNLDGIDIPNTVTKLGDSAFSGCFLLRDIKLPNSLEHLGNNALKNCYSLTEVDIPSGVTFLGVGVFMSCVSLQRLVLPKGVTSISVNTFASCYSCTEYVFLADTTPNLTSTTAFNGINTLAKMYFRDEILEEVKTATNWVTYAKYMHPLSEWEGYEDYVKNNS